MAPKQAPSVGQRSQVHSIARPVGGVARCSANILPCRAHHDGGVNASKRYWRPRVNHDGSLGSYFRGRRLKGTSLALPPGYKGVIMKPTVTVSKDSSLCSEIVAEFEKHASSADSSTRRTEEETLQTAIHQGEYDTGDVEVLDQLADLDGIVVWGHDEVPNQTENAFCKGLQEWIAMATAIHAPHCK